MAYLQLQQWLCNSLFTATVVAITGSFTATLVAITGLFTATAVAMQWLIYSYSSGYAIAYLQLQ